MAALPPDPVFTFRKNMAQINCLMLSVENNKELLYAGTVQGVVHIWDLKTNREIKNVKVSEEACLAIVHHNGMLVTQEKSKCLRYWQVSDSEWQLKTIVENGYPGFCKILVTDRRLYYPSEYGIIKVLDGDNKWEINYSKSRKLGEVMCMKYVNSSDHLLVAYESGMLILWNNDKVGPKIESELTNDDSPMCLEFCEITKEGILGTSGETLKKFCLQKNVLEERLVVNLINPGVSCVSISKDGKLCVAGCWDGRIRYFSMKHLKLLAVLDHHEGSLLQIMFTEQKLSFFPTGSVLAGGSDGRISLWNLYTERTLSHK